MELTIFDTLGSWVINLLNEMGGFLLFLIRTVRTLFTTKLKVQKVVEQMKQVGVDSMSIIVLTGVFTGMVFAFQTYIGFHRFGGEQFLGPVTALAMLRELGPVLTGLMVTGRACSSIAAEIGAMQISEQIDALRTLCINPFQYLMVPRILAGIIILPFLSLFCAFLGILGAYIIAIYALGLNPSQFINMIKEYVELQDITGGLIKASVFGLILTWVGCYKGYRTSGGARGVGISTTAAVVLSSTIILAANYFLTAALFETT